MKKLLVLVFIWMLCCPAMAEVLESDIYEYVVGEEGTATIVGCTMKEVEELAIPETLDGIPVTRIGDDAFEDTSLKKVIIPNSIVEIGRNPFVGWRNELQFAVAEDHPTFKVVENALYDRVEKRLICYSMWRGNRVREFVIPEGTLVLGDNACYNLQGCSVRIPDSVERLEGNPFAEGEVELILSENHPALELVDGALYTRADGVLHAYMGDRDVEEYAVREGTTAIAQKVFADMDLKKVVIPEGVRSIGDGAFGWTELTELVLPESLTEIGAEAFVRTGISELVIPGSVVCVGESAFWQCDALVCPVLQEGVEEIGFHAFGECSALSDIVLPASLRRIGDEAFYMCRSLKQVEFNDGLAEIGEKAFFDSGIEIVEFPSSLEVIHKSAYFACEYLTEVTVPGNVRKLESSVFSHCENLTSAVLEEGIEEIGVYVFSNCTSLKRVVLPASLTKIGAGVFEKCPPELVVTVTPGSYAEQYCLEKGIAIG